VTWNVICIRAPGTLASLHGIISRKGAINSTIWFPSVSNLCTLFHMGTASRWTVSHVAFIHIYKRMRSNVECTCHLLTHAGAGVKHG
jgi:hypothetical protein